MMAQPRFHFFPQAFIDIVLDGRFVFGIMERREFRRAARSRAELFRSLRQKHDFVHAFIQNVNRQNVARGLDRRAAIDRKADDIVVASQCFQQLVRRCGGHIKFNRMMHEKKPDKRWKLRPIKNRLEDE